MMSFLMLLLVATMGATPSAEASLRLSQVTLLQLQCARQPSHHDGGYLHYGQVAFDFLEAGRIRTEVATFRSRGHDGLSLQTPAERACTLLWNALQKDRHPDLLVSPGESPRLRGVFDESESIWLD